MSSKVSSGQKARVDPAPIVQLSIAYWGSQALFTANRLGLFPVLARGPRTAEEVAAELAVQTRPTRLLLNACAALGLVEVENGRFRNAPVSQVFLVPGTEAYMGDALRYGDDMYGVWSRLEELLRSGRPVLGAEAYLGEDPERTRHFVHGMHNRALGLGRALVELVDLSGRRRLLDVGGGPGTYSALFAARCPGLEARVLDLPEVVALATEILSTLPGGERVGTLAGDYHTTPFPPGNDVVLISGVFHRETEGTCRSLIARAQGCMEPGGLLVVSDVFTDAGGASPAFSSLFGLNMALSADDGGVHADADVASWMEGAGFDDVGVRPFPPPMPHRVVIGKKPGTHPHPVPPLEGERTEGGQRRQP
jgi:hypothetical protein